MTEACHLVLVLGDRPKENTWLFASTSLAFLQGCSLCVAYVLLNIQSIVGSMSTSAASCFPRSDSSLQTDGSFLSVFMTFITTLASFTASLRSTFFPWSIFDEETVLESSCSVAQRANSRALQIVLILFKRYVYIDHTVRITCKSMLIC